MRVTRPLLSSRILPAARAVIAACLAPLAFSACGGEEGGFDLKIIHTACHDPSVDYLSRASIVEVIVTGDGMGAIQAEERGTSKGMTMPDVPEGKNRVATVRTRNPSNKSEVWAIGTSDPFDVEKGKTASVSVVLRQVNMLSPAADKSNRCVTMEEARAGHTSVKLKDGRVLLVGGYQTVATPAGTGENFLASAEIFDPTSDTFYAAAPPCENDVCFQAARAPGVLLQDGRVLVVGGEAPHAVDTAAIYDPANDRWSIRKMTTPRKGHTASLLGELVIIVGGMDHQGNVLDTIEVFDPRSGSFTQGNDDTRLKGSGNRAAGRAFHVAVSRDANTVWIAGGIDGNMAVVDAVGVYLLSGRDNISLRTVLGDKQLFHPVARAGAVSLNRKLVVTGGAGVVHAEDGVQNLRSTVQWLDHAVPGTAAANTAEKRELASVDTCVVALDGKRALALGGLNQAGAAQPHVHILAWNDETSRVEAIQVPVPAIDKRDPPSGHVACTDLGDGRVLITGGVKGSEATNRAEIYTIQPLK